MRCGAIEETFFYATGEHPVNFFLDLASGGRVGDVLLAAGAAALAWLHRSAALGAGHRGSGG